MSFKNAKINNYRELSKLLVVLVAGISVFLFWGQIQAAVVNMSGYAWSSNVGWISLSGTNYNVVLDDVTGDLSGYAWSSNIGWIKFGGNSGCPGTNACDPVLDTATGEIEGWARACSVFASGCSGGLKTATATGGWDGWISLNCNNTGDCATSNYKWSLVGPNITGFAWGSTVVGWVNAYNINTGVPSPTVVFEVLDPATNTWLATPLILNINTGEDIELRWSATNAQTCSGSVGGAANGFTTGGAVSGVDNDVVEPGTNQTGTFTVICNGLSGNVSKTLTVQTIDSEVELNARPVIINRGASVTLDWNVNSNDPTACSISGSNGYSKTLNVGEEIGSEVINNVAGEIDFTLACNANGSNPGATDTAKVRINFDLFDS